MPFKKGHGIGGRKPQKITRIEWALIDSYIAEGTRWAYSVIDGKEKDLKGLTDKERLELRLKAYGIVVKLAPNRITGPEGGPIITKAVDAEQLDRFLKRHVKS